MCFYNDDYEWYADVSDVLGVILDRDRKCWECGGQMHKGDWCMHVFQQEHEECQRCEWEELNPDEEPCEKHDYGETFEYWRCVSCSKLLEVIWEVETEEECPVHARQPDLCELGDEFYQNDNAVKWANRATEKFPELAGHRFVKAAHEMATKRTNVF